MGLYVTPELNEFDTPALTELSMSSDPLCFVFSGGATAMFHNFTTICICLIPYAYVKTQILLTMIWETGLTWI